MITINLLGKQKNKAPKPSEESPKSKYAVNPVLLIAFIGIIGFAIIQWGLPFIVSLQTPENPKPKIPIPKQTDTTSQVVQDTTQAVQEPEEEKPVVEEIPVPVKTAPDVAFNTGSTKNLITSMKKFRGIADTDNNYYLVSIENNKLIGEIQYGSEQQSQNINAAIRQNFTGVNFTFESDKKKNRLVAIGRNAAGFAPPSEQEMEKLFSLRELKREFRNITKNNSVVLKDWIASSAIDRDSYKIVPLTIKILGTGTQIESFLDVLAKKTYNIISDKITVAYYPTGGSAATSTQLVIICDVIIP